MRAWAALAALLCVYGAALARLYWRVGEPMDGFAAILNALHLGGAQLPGGHLYLVRPPLGSLLMAPAVAFSFARGGAEAAVRSSHVVQIACACAVVALAWSGYRRLFGERIAAAAAVALAFSPLLLMNAPFAFQDVAAATLVVPLVASFARLVGSGGARAFAASAALGALAAAAKYHQAVLLAVPAACAWLEGRRRLECLALPAVSLALAAALLSALAAVGGSEGLSLVEALRMQLSLNFPRPGASAAFYARQAAAMFGLVPAAFMAAGAVASLRDGTTEMRAHALAAAGGLAFLALALTTQDSRYFLFVAPSLYACAGEAVLRLERRFGRRAALAALAVFLAGCPWNKAQRLVSALVETPEYGDWFLPALAGPARRAAEDGRSCAYWMEGDLELRPARAERLLDLWPWVVNDYAMSLYVPGLRRIEDAALPPSPPAGCARPVVIVPRHGPSGAPRWESPERARLYRWRSGGAGLVAAFRNGG